MDILYILFLYCIVWFIFWFLNVAWNVDEDEDEDGYIGQYLLACFLGFIWPMYIIVLIGKLFKILANFLKMEV